jgi:hypothetical protein
MRKVGRWASVISGISKNAAQASRIHSEVPVVSTTELPPWGQMDEELLALIDSSPVPPDWTPHQPFETWRDKTIERIADTLWPIYRANGSAWQSPAVAELFDADFSLMAPLHPILGLPIRGMLSTTATHSDLFAEEDDEKVGFGNDYTRYDPSLNGLVKDQFRNVLHAGYLNKVGTIPLQFKQVFQRPRPWQVAFIQGRSGYQYRVAASANTPSLVSGHCFQGSLAVCNVYAEFGHAMSSESVEVLKQFAVDIGDRRVFAGVHYPSDNLSSWFAALELVPYVFDRSRVSAVKKFLCGAINGKSAVFAAIRGHVAANKKSPYRAIVAAIGKSCRAGRGG